MSDIDLFQHMSYAKYVKLLFLASDAILLPCLSKDFLDAARIKAIKTLINFKYQSKLGDHVLLRVNSSRIIKDSFTLEYNFTLENSNIQIAHGTQEFVIESLHNNQKSILPDSLVASLGQIQTDEEAKVVYDDKLS